LIKHFLLNPITVKKLFTSAVLLLFIISLLSSCLKNEKEYLPLGEVQLQMTEELSVNSRRLHFNFFTEEEFECLDNTIRYSSSSDPETINISLVDVEVSDLCLTGPGPAIESIDLGTYELGNYPVNIKVADYENTGTLQVNQDMYVVGFNNPQMLTTYFDTLYRIPDNTIWGLVGYYELEGVEKVDAFLDSLESIGAMPLTLNQGDYGYFQADSAGKIIIPEYIGFEYSKSFVYDYSGSMAEVQNIISYFADVYPQYLYIYLYNSEGQVFESNN
jgi:hypothetical protein